MNHYPHHIGDFNNATRHLTRVERSIYRDLLDLYYDTEQPLTSDLARLSRVILCDSNDAPALQAVLDEFFDLGDGLYHNARCDAEIARFLAEQPERALKKENERERQRRSRARRRELFEALRGVGVVPAFDAPMHVLQTLLDGVTSQGVTREATGKPEPEPEPKKEKKARATRLPTPFVLANEWREYAIKTRPDLIPDRVAEDFADFWHAKPDGAKLDWFATWRRWVRETRAAPQKPADVARATAPLDPRSLYVGLPPMTPDERARSDDARRLAMSAFKTSKAA